MRETTFGATALYQFFENQWMHPFVGAGVEVARERHTAEALPEIIVGLRAKGFVLSQVGSMVDGTTPAPAQ